MQTNLILSKSITLIIKTDRDGETEFANISDLIAFVSAPKRHSRLSITMVTSGTVGESRAAGGVRRGL